MQRSPIPLQLQRRVSQCPLQPHRMALKSDAGAGSRLVKIGVRHVSTRLFEHPIRVEWATTDVVDSILE